MTAAQIAGRLEVSVRTIYRDVQDLSLSGVPLIAETGIGYRLDKHYNLPPVTFTEPELESIVLGVRMVQAWSDRQLAAEATRALLRITSVLPDNLKSIVDTQELLVPDFHSSSTDVENLPLIRQSIKTATILDIEYTRADGEQSSRRIWPLGLFFWGKVWTLVAWCRMRSDYRQFRIDRIRKLTVTGQAFRAATHQTLDHYLLQVCTDDLSDIP